MKSITFGKRLTEVRKDKKMSQDEVGKLVGVHGAVIGIYERNEVKPSIEVATKIIDALGVTLDYLVKDGQYEQIDNDTLKKLKAIQELDSDTKAHIFATIDAFIKASKLKNIAAL
ncbi:DNA-binding transcriptional regulator, XRE-family HTH domain [Chryseobacterium ureilyticum]|uniref:DNA-binding transcriptional regulator, XRE-family HTH domain n=1 Tax=Chryseobacterium ureilyticum TaxID=373668 RepID=A0A1N7QTG5_9FLAO|nr:helix-turn-helix transcriptional regulator [Chryseobacterium ureilyticum]SIT26175.1 DNA-binding transcriptional regulator, XRE-family HTH domain [Chryseobacterium ureilyticum]